MSCHVSHDGLSDGATGHISSCASRSDGKVGMLFLVFSDPTDHRLDVFAIFWMNNYFGYEFKQTGVMGVGSERGFGRIYLTPKDARQTFVDIHINNSNR